MLGAVLFASSVMGSKLQQQSQRNHTRASDHEAPTPALTHSLAVALALESHAYERELQEAIELARAAGRHLQRSLLEAKSIISKDQDTADFVTASDQYIEAMLFNRLKVCFPNHQFIGEESSASTGQIAPLTDEPTWIIDPIDGTTNFIHSNPLTCVSIGLMVNKVPVLGVVYAPCYDEFYIAVRDRGAYLNGKRLHVTEAKRIQDSIIIHEFGYVRDRDGVKRACRCLENIINCNPHSVREYGSGVLDLAFLAGGRVDAVYCGVAGNGWKPWDYAAGWLLVSEAGGVLSTLTGGEFHTHVDSMIGASTPELADQLRKILAQE